MFEVIVTYRPDYREAPLDRYSTWEQAREIAQAFALQHAETVVRTWVRPVKDAQVTQSPADRGK
jgi:hypothetical protein